MICLTLIQLIYCLNIFVVLVLMFAVDVGGVCANVCR